MLLYEDDDARLDAAAHHINQGLRKEQFCIYASIHAFEGKSKLSASNLASKVIDYQKNLEKGNLMLLDFKPFYDAASVSDLSRFTQLKNKLESILQSRISNGMCDKIMVYADARTAEPPVAGFAAHSVHAGRLRALSIRHRLARESAKADSARQHAGDPSLADGISNAGGGEPSGHSRLQYLL